MTRSFIFAFGLIAVVHCCQVARADDSVTAARNEAAWSELRLSDNPSPSVIVEPRQSADSEVRRIRQERAAYRYNQRIARSEYRAWIGYEPLRPNWAAVPMMTSRYPDRHTIVVPVYVP